MTGYQRGQALGTADLYFDAMAPLLTGERPGYLVRGDVDPDQGPIRLDAAMVAKKGVPLWTFLPLYSWSSLAP